MPSIAEPTDGANDHEARPMPTARLGLAGSSDGPEYVRARVRTLLVGHDLDRVTDALLVADELVSDALASVGQPREARLRIAGARRELRIEVDSSATPAAVTHQRRDEGLGRLVLEQLTADWGVHRTDGVTTTWAVLALAPETT